MKRVLILAAAAFLIAAPLSFAQTTPQPHPATPPAATAPAATMPAPAPAATPAPSASAASTEASSASPRGCRTHKAAGESCACLSDTSRIGTSTAHPSGYNVCVRPS